MFIISGCSQYNPKQDTFKIIYPPADNRDTKRKSSRKKIALSICDESTTCMVPSKCDKSCDLNKKEPKIQFFGQFKKNDGRKAELNYVYKGEKFHLVCNLPKTKLNPIGMVLTLFNLHLFTMFYKLIWHLGFKLSF